MFLEDYAYFSLLLISLYEINNDKSSLEKSIEIMKGLGIFFIIRNIIYYKKMC